MARTLPMTVIRLPGFKGARPAESREFDLAGAEGGPGAQAAAAGAGQEAVAAIEVRKEELTSEQRRRVADEDDVLAVVPSVPFTLPKPVAKPAEGGPGGGGSGATGGGRPEASWGIAAVGAGDAPVTAGANVVVAVLDSGIVAHPAFAGIDIDFKNFTSEPGDVIGHGTHTVATIFGRDVDGVRIGVARGVKKALIGKVLSRTDTCTTEMIIDGMMWALLGGAHVINMSLGVDFVGYREFLVNEKGFPDPKATSIALAGYRLNIRLFDRLSMFLAVDDRGFAGSFVVAAAGNESARPDYTITTAPPAAGERFFSVAAVDRALEVASFSNDDVDIAAPGVGILSAGLDGGLRLDDGTSMAAPHVAGVAALYADALIKAGTFNAIALEKKLRSSAKPLAGSPRDVGDGLVRWIKP